MNRNPSLIPRLCETQWQPFTTHILCPIHCIITTPLLLDFTLHMMTPCFLFFSFVIYNVPLDASTPSSCCPSSTGRPFICHHLEKLVLFGSEHDPLDNVQKDIYIFSLSCNTWALQHAMLTYNHVSVSFFMLFIVIVDAIVNDRHQSACIRLTFCAEPFSCNCHCVCCQSMHQGKE